MTTYHFSANVAGAKAAASVLDINYSHLTFLSLNLVISQGQLCITIKSTVFKDGLGSYLK